MKIGKKFYLMSFKEKYLHKRHIMKIIFLIKKINLYKEVQILVRLTKNYN